MLTKSVSSARAKAWESRESRRKVKSFCQKLVFANSQSKNSHYQIPIHRYKKSRNTALMAVNHNSFPFNFPETPQWIFPFGQMPVHFWHIKQSPLVSIDPSSGSPISEGHFFVHAAQPEIQFSLSLLSAKYGSTGRSENIAPIGHKIRQKKRSCTHMPHRMRMSRTTPAKYPSNAKFPAWSMEKTSHGLLPFSFT